MLPDNKAKHKYKHDNFIKNKMKKKHSKLNF